MRRIDKKLNIIKNNILAESRYIQNKFGLTENEMCEEDDVVEETTDESLKRDTSNTTKSGTGPNKNVVGSDNKNALKKMASDPHKLMKGIESQANYNESEDDISKT